MYWSIYLLKYIYPLSVRDYEKLFPSSSSSPQILTGQHNQGSWFFVENNQCFFLTEKFSHINLFCIIFQLYVHLQFALKKWFHMLFMRTCSMYPLENISPPLPKAEGFESETLPNLSSCSSTVSIKICHMKNEVCRPFSLKQYYQNTELQRMELLPNTKLVYG